MHVVVIEAMSTCMENSAANVEVVDDDFFATTLAGVPDVREREVGYVRDYGRRSEPVYSIRQTACKDALLQNPEFHDLIFRLRTA